MAQPTPPAVPNLGFLTILQEPNGYLGGYLVTNLWGRPLEFRVSTAVQPNRVQQILYAGTLQPYVYADLIGKALIEKAAVPVHLVVTDRQQALDLRLRLEAPVVWLTAADEPPAAPAEAATVVRPAVPGRGALFCHAHYPGDVAAAREILERVEGVVDLAEPFVRIKEAMGEARKLGVTSRSA